MNYNFDEIINRNGTDSVKWDGVEGRWGRNDLIPMWVADMDFRTAPFVIEALKKAVWSTKCWVIHLPAKNGPNPLLTGSKNGMDGRFVKKC